MADKKVATMYETTCYSRFRFIDGNRPIDHAKKIIESIKEIGVLWQPVLVNERFEIIDGQGRFFALKTLGRPIIYIVQPGLGIKHVRYLNKNATIWKVKDYVHSYAVGEDCKESYHNLSELMRQFPEFKETLIVRAASDNGLHSDKREELKNGWYDELDFERMNLAITRLAALRRIDKVIPEKTKFKNNVYAGILFCMHIAETDAEFSITQLEDAISKYYSKMPVARTIPEAIKNLDTVYNNNRRINNRYQILRKYEDKIAEIRYRNVSGKKM